MQEALTNVIRHADATSADVLLRYQPDSLSLDVRDYGHGHTGPTQNGGHGLAGMHERVALLGGSLATQNHPDDGFLVHTNLPLDPPP